MKCIILMSFITSSITNPEVLSSVPSGETFFDWYTVWLAITKSSVYRYIA